MTAALATSSVRVGWRLAWSRLSAAFCAAALLVPSTFVYVIAMLERGGQLSGALDRTLLGVAFGFTIPLVAFVVVEQLAQADRLDSGLSLVVRSGHDRRLCLVGTFAVAIGVPAAAGALIGLSAVLGASGAELSRLAGSADLLVISWVGVLAGGSYGAIFAAASLLGKKGAGRAWVLVLDWLLGSTGGALAVVWPRAHIGNLLGGAAPLGIEPAESSLILGALLLAAVLTALGRTAR